MNEEGKRMKKKTILFWMLTFLPLLVVGISLFFLPEQIPAHYGISGEVNRWGSKFETLLFPTVSLLLGIFLAICIRFARKKEGHDNNDENTMRITGIFLLLFFNALTLFFLYLDFNQVTDMSFSKVDINQWIFGFLGILLIIIGNLLPKVQRNALIGLRTRWSMKNDITWKKSQRFGGAALIITGALMLLFSICLKGIACFLCSVGILIVSLPIDIYYTYQVAKKYGDCK